MLCTVSPGPASPSCAAVLRCQLTPLREVQITACVAWCPAAPTPAAMNPSDVLFSTHIASPVSIGVMPLVDASVQDWPFGLVQIDCGPTASQPPGPPASRAAGYPSGAWTFCPLPAAYSGARRQVAPPLAETKNCCRTTPSLVCEPIVTMVFPEATMRFTVWKTPRCCCPGYMPMVSADCAAGPWFPSFGAWFACWFELSWPNFGPCPVSRARGSPAP